MIFRFSPSAIKQLFLASSAPSAVGRISPEQLMLLELLELCITGDLGAESFPARVALCGCRRITLQIILLGTVLALANFFMFLHR